MLPLNLSDTAATSEDGSLRLDSAIFRMQVAEGCVLGLYFTGNRFI